MKKIIAICLTLLFFISCNRNDEKKIIITKFENIFVDSIVPIKNKTYTSYNLFIKGYANDSIEVRKSKSKNDNSYSYFYKGDIDIRLDSDYYGENVQYFYFNPYKATEGRLEITYSLD